MGKIRERKAVISLARSISLSKQIFTVKLKRKMMCGGGGGGFSQITAMARKLLEKSERA